MFDIKIMASHFYKEVDPRRNLEREDAHLIDKDRTTMANLPRQAVHHEWPDRQENWYKRHTDAGY